LVQQSDLLYVSDGLEFQNPLQTQTLSIESNVNENNTLRTLSDFTRNSALTEVLVEQILSQRKHLNTEPSTPILGQSPGRTIVVSASALPSPANTNSTLAKSTSTDTNQVPPPALNAPSSSSSSNTPNTSSNSLNTSPPTSTHGASAPTPASPPLSTHTSPRTRAHRHKSTRSTKRREAVRVDEEIVDIKHDNDGDDAGGDDTVLTLDSRILIDADTMASSAATSCDTTPRSSLGPAVAEELARKAAVLVGATLAASSSNVKMESKIESKPKTKSKSTHSKQSTNNVARVTPVVVRHDTWIKLNVGGRVFSTTKGTLTMHGDNMLARMFGSNWQSAMDETGAYLIDRSPEYFAPLLQYLRCGRLTLDPGIHPANVLEEARFFGLDVLVPQLEKLVKETSPDATSLSRKELTKILLSSEANKRQRARGMNFQGADLSNLDLSGMNMARAKLAGADLQHTLLDGVSLQEADLRGANLSGASLRGANLGGANLENATLRGVNLADNGGIRANLESANLKSCNLEDAIMSGGNFRCCNLKNANLANADLGRSDLAGANLEGANLRGANLGKSNLIGANLRLATFDHRTGL